MILLPEVETIRNVWSPVEQMPQGLSKLIETSATLTVVLRQLHARLCTTPIVNQLTQERSQLRDFILKNFEQYESQTKIINSTAGRSSSLFSATPRYLYEAAAYTVKITICTKILAEHDKVVTKIYSASITVPRAHRFTRDATSLMMKYFEQSPYVSREALSHLIQETGLTERQINMWFTNRRSRSKRLKVIHDSPANSHGEEEQLSESMDDGDALTISPQPSPCPSPIARPVAMIPMPSLDDYEPEAKDVFLPIPSSPIVSKRRNSTDEFMKIAQKSQVITQQQRCISPIHDIYDTEDDFMGKQNRGRAAAKILQFDGVNEEETIAMAELFGDAIILLSTHLN